MRLNLWVLLGLALCAVSIYDVQVSADVAPSEYECRPYIEKAINELKVADVPVLDSTESDETNLEVDNASTTEQSTELPADSGENGDSNENSTEETSPAKDESNENDSNENQTAEQADDQSNLSDEQDQPASEQDANSVESTENAAEQIAEDQTAEQTDDQDSNENSKETSSGQPESTVESTDENGDSKEGDSKEGDSQENDKSAEVIDNDSNESVENTDDSTTEKVEETDNDSTESQELDPVADSGSKEEDGSAEEQAPTVVESEGDNESGESQEQPAADSKEDSVEESAQNTVESEVDNDSSENSKENDEAQDTDSKQEDSVEEAASSTPEADADSTESPEVATDSKEEDNSVEEQKTVEENSEETPKTIEELSEEAQSTETQSTENQSAETPSTETETQSTENESEEKSRAKRSIPDEQENDTNEEQSNETEETPKEESDENVTEEQSTESMPEEDLTMEFEIPANLRDRSHINTLLRLDEEGSIKDAALQKTGDFILKDLKRIYDNAVKPLETMYKYRELSNRHFGDPEIFSKPLVLFMGPWSGGKSTILNYLTENEYTPNSVRSGAEPSPAYFNIMMHGDEPEVLDGTQLAADWTFSGLQKFGQGLNDRLRGHKLPNKLLSRVNIVEIPGILEVRKQVSKVFPFNDACQWFIDRADIIILVYDPSKLDAGPETEAILDQLKGREYQTRILLNKADQVKPEELLRVQGALIWNISPLMSSAQPPVMYTVSLWSHPFENGAPIRLLQAQEKAFLGDLHDAIDKRIENKIASARRFAVRIRNHAKMVDCYLTTYYNQKSLFSNKKYTADQIIENPHTYNIYEGLSTLTNISRYDLPDPEVYLDFFRLNPLWEFKKLAETCTYFKGCPIKKLDMAIAYDLPELVGRYKKLLEKNLTQLKAEHKGVCLENCSENKTEPEPSVKLSKHR